jgi:hypothetical protein
MPMNTSSSISLTPAALHLPSSISWTLPPLTGTARLIGHLAPLQPYPETSPSPSLSQIGHPCSLSPFLCQITSHWRSFCRPQLRVPPPLTATGDPIVPEPEKPFLQKYWHYIAIALIALGAFALLMSLRHTSCFTRVSDCPRWRRRSARIVNAQTIATVLCSMEFRACAAQFALRGRESSACCL